MPLIHGKSKKAFEHNVKTEMEAHPDKRKQDLAIAYSVKRHAMRKMHKGGMYASGGPVSNPPPKPPVNPDQETLGHKIGYPGMAKGGHVHDEMCMSKGGSCYAEGGMIPEEDAARGHDPIADGHYDLENEDLHPMDEPEHGAERMMHKEHDFGFKAQNYEDLPHPMEQDDMQEPAEEDMPNHMFAKGGIAKAIMMKHKKSMPMMAHGGRIEEGESIDNQYPDEHPDNDYLSDEEDTPYFNYSRMDTFDPNEQRKMQISKIMRGLHARNR